MSKRVRAADIAPMRHVYAGIINAEKCIAYLRMIGVELDDATADGWLDSQAVHRFLKRMKGRALTVERWTCACGEMEGFSLHGEKAPRRKPKTRQKPNTCEECGGRFTHSQTWYSVARDGTEKDHRPEMERFSPFDWRELLDEHRNRGSAK